ncbi:MAG TPA: DUF4185 domain-containing protein, partial [Thermomicrobiales bacterium]|nr:DUF4185 domain-containing protein [Thermomicrobiales bacterium]
MSDRMHQCVSRRTLVAGSSAIAATALTRVAVDAQGTPAASPVPASDLPLAQVAILTGSDPAAVNQTGSLYEVDGTDLGSSFLFHDEIVLAFGDTFAEFKTDWRSNTLAISTDDDPSDGIVFDRMIVDRPGHAKELLASKKEDFVEMTVIPTYGVAVG